jgi:hypothetical protein
VFLFRSLFVITFLWFSTQVQANRISENVSSLCVIETYYVYEST